MATFLTILVVVAIVSGAVWMVSQVWDTVKVMTEAEAQALKRDILINFGGVVGQMFVDDHSTKHLNRRL